MVGNLAKTAIVFRSTSEISRQARSANRGRPMNRMRKGWAIIATAGALAVSVSIVQAAEPVTIQARTAEPHGQHLTAQDNRVLYVFSGDRQNESTCYDACALA